MYTSYDRGVVHFGKVDGDVPYMVHVDRNSARGLWIEVVDSEVSAVLGIDLPCTWRSCCNSEEKAQ